MEDFLSYRFFFIPLHPMSARCGWDIGHLGKKQRDVMSIFVAGNLENFNATQDDIVGFSTRKRGLASLYLCCIGNFQNLQLEM